MHVLSPVNRMHNVNMKSRYRDQNLVLADDNILPLPSSSFTLIILCTAVFQQQHYNNSPATNQQSRYFTTLDNLSIQYC